MSGQEAKRTAAAGAPRRRGRRPSLTIAQIALVALNIADEEGLDAVTVKRIGQALGVGAMTLYGYVRTKEEILDSMTDVAIGTVELPTRGSWQMQLCEFFTNTHEMLTQHPAVALLNARQPMGAGPATLAAVERVLELIVSSGLRGEAAVGALRSLMSYTLGSALFYVARQGALAESALHQRATNIHAAPRTSFPVIVQLADELATESKADHFEQGLIQLVAGIESAVAGQPAGKPAHWVSD